MVDALVSMAATKLYNMARDEVMLLSGLKGKLQDLSSELIMIQAVLHDAEMKQVKDESIRIWLQRLKYVAYEIEDMLEEWDFQVSNTSSPFSYMIYPIKKHRFGLKLNAIIEKLAKISAEKNRYHFREIRVKEIMEERQTSSFVEQSSIIGRDIDKEILRRKLMGEDFACRNGRVPVISIVGMGGLGKTTLAQVVFNTIKSSFEIYIWLCVSNDFNIKDIMANIVKNAGGNIHKEDQIELIERKVLEVIENKRYLLVLDDVWNDDELMWEPLQKILYCGANGSRIIVTTRNRGVANVVRSMYIHDLGLLSEDICWSIFEKIVFDKSNDEQRYGDLEDVGRQIVKRCSGIPLAVKTIASAVRKKGRGRELAREQLENILNHELWDISQYSTVGILPALMLSYIELPSELKNCFCYCALFKKDFIFEKDLLNKLWVAQGYIGVGSDEERDLESVAEEYFNELVDRSLLQEPTLDKHGSLISCKMHDLVHDLALWLSKTEFSMIAMNQKSENVLSLGNARHCAIAGYFEWEWDIALIGIEKLRTLLHMTGNDKSDNVMKKLKSVRVLGLRQWSRKKHVGGLGGLVHLRYLNLSEVWIEQLPTSIGNLKQLRYLNLEKSPVKKLPKSITSLPHLQTLNLFMCWSLKKLPNEIHKMGSLRHLDVGQCWQLERLPEGIGRLTLLQTLGLFPVAAVGEDKGKGRRSNIEELGGLNCLCGELVVSNLKAVVNGDEALPAKLRDKTTVEFLGLDWGRPSHLHGRASLFNMTESMGVLEALCPPSQLAKLEIKEYPGRAFPIWMGDSIFVNLEQVTLRDCTNCTQLPPLGRLPCLKRLIITGLSEVNKVGSEFFFGGDGSTSKIVAFPQLEYLRFSQMQCWQKWEKPISTDDGAAASEPPITMPRLRELHLHMCLRLEEVPSIFTTALQTLNIVKSPELRHLPPTIQSLTFLGSDGPGATRSLWKAAR